MCKSILFRLGFSGLLLLALLPSAKAAEAPRLVQKDGRYALLVDGKPYLILGGQIHNSSGWPSELPQVWKSMADLHANTVAAPVYWEQLEPQQGHFDFSNVDPIVRGARAQTCTLSCSGLAPGRTVTITTRRHGSRPIPSAIPA
jgi:hypothetical protein